MMKRRMLWVGGLVSLLVLIGTSAALASTSSQTLLAGPKVKAVSPTKVLSAHRATLFVKCITTNPGRCHGKVVIEMKEGTNHKWTVLSRNHFSIRPNHRAKIHLHLTHAGKKAIAQLFDSGPGMQGGTCPIVAHARQHGTAWQKTVSFAKNDVL